jgi:hypothetical protein
MNEKTLPDLLQRLREPFAPEDVTWKPGTVANGRCLALAYADLRAYMDRLDEVAGLAWSVRYTGWDDRLICELTVDGVTRASTGEMTAQDDRNGMGGTVAEAQAFKRAAAMFGLGRYLYSLPAVWVEYDAERKRISEAGHKELQTRYRVWYSRVNERRQAA